MSVREYIGARYVPVFSDPIQWDSTVSYEPLTVVMNQGTSYVSKQSVPAGIEITNETYWLRWADYNAQLEEYIRQVQTYSESISALNDALPIANFDNENTVKDAIDDLSALLPGSAFDSTNTVDARFDTIESNDWVSTNRIANKAVTYDKIADSLRKKLITDDSIRNECMIMLGDSYAQGVAALGPSTSGANWQDLLISMLGLTDVYKYKGGGGGFTNPSESTSGSASTVPIGTTYNEILTYAYDYINGLGRADEVKHIIIQAGWNDSNTSGMTESMVETAVVNCISDLHSHFPNAKVYIACTYCGNTTKTSELTKSTVSEACLRACNRKGAAFADCANLPWLFQQASYDTVHPTQDMQNYIAGFIGRLLVSGYADDYEGWSADNVCWISKDHEFIYNQRIVTEVDSGTNNIIETNWSRSYNSGRSNQDFPVVFTNDTDSSNGIGLGRFYVDGHVRIPYAIQSSGSLNGGDGVTITPNVRIKFH